MHTFGYTNVSSGDSTELTYLRSRYYSSGTGRFLTRDTWDGDANNPLSLNRWNYVEANPINLVDPSGKFPEQCRSHAFKWLYAKCVLDYYHLESAGSIFFNGDAVANVKGSWGCWSGRIEYRAPGYIEGYSWFAGPVWGGKEVVYSFAKMDRDEFTYIGGGLSDSMIGGGASFYVGLADGLRSDRSVEDHYKGLAFVRTAGFDLTVVDELSAGLGATLSTSATDWKLRTMSVYLGASAAAVGLPVFDVGIGSVYYTPSGTYHLYSHGELGTMLIDLTQGKYTPITPAAQQLDILSALPSIRANVAQQSAYYFWVYEEMRNEELRSENNN